ncbi:MAG: tyrosine-type recombinase/integrase, partial [Microgenomates group bacterium]
MQLLEQDREQRIFSNFVDTIAAEKTKMNYLTDMRNYLVYIQLWVTDTDNNTKQQEWKHQKLSMIVDMPKEQIVDNIKSYILHMRKRGLSSSSMRGFYYAIKFFYDSNDVDLGLLKWKWLKKFMGEATPIHEDRAYDKEEINKLLKFCDLKLKAAVLLLSSTGMRIGALSTMLKSHLIEKGDCYGIKVYNGIKGKGQYFTYCTPEARKAVEDYFQFREQYGEKLTPNSPLFRDDFDTGIPGSARYAKALSYDALRMDIYEHLIKSGLRQVDHTTTKNRKEVMMSHGFRKFFSTQLVEADLKTEKRWLLEGHELKGNDSSYVKVTEKQLFQEYQKAIPHLTINPNQELLKKVEKLKEEKNEVSIMELKHRQTVDLLLEENRKTNEENQLIRKQMEELRQQTTDEFEELPDRVLERLAEQLGKNGIDFSQWLKANGKKDVMGREKDKILIEEDNTNYELIPCPPYHT